MCWTNCSFGLFYLFDVIFLAFFLHPLLFAFFKFCFHNTFASVRVKLTEHSFWTPRKYKNKIHRRRNRWEKMRRNAEKHRNKAEWKKSCVGLWNSYVRLRVKLHGNLTAQFTIHIYTNVKSISKSPSCMATILLENNTKEKTINTGLCFRWIPWNLIEAAMIPWCNL